MADDVEVVDRETENPYYNFIVDDPDDDEAVTVALVPFHRVKFITS